MIDSVFPLREHLRAQSRLYPPRFESGWLVTGIQFAALLFLGASAAVMSEKLDVKVAIESIVGAITGSGDFKLRLPGHAIFSSIFPIAFGLAIIPRRGAGSIMGIGALLMTFVLPSYGIVRGLGSTVSVAVIGLALDLALRNTNGGWRVYFGFAIAGLGANMIAFAAQATAKYYGMSGGGGKPFSVWLPTAALSYPLFGLLAGLLSAAVWFRLGTKRPSENLS